MFIKNILKEKHCMKGKRDSTPNQTNLEFHSVIEGM